MAYSVDSISDDCYEGTTCLINKYNIRDESKLAELEAMITLAITSEMEQVALKDGFNENDYKAIHRQLFDTLYTWAGEYRTIDISKKGTAFAKHDEIPELLMNYNGTKNLDHGIEKMREHGIMRITKGRSANYVIQNVHVGIQSKGSHRGSPRGEKSK